VAEAQGVGDVFLSLGFEGVAGLEGEGDVWAVAVDLVGEFESGLAADDVGAHAFGYIPNLSLGPAEGGGDLAAGLPAVSI